MRQQIKDTIKEVAEIINENLPPEATQLSVNSLFFNYKKQDRGKLHLALNMLRYAHPEVSHTSDCVHLFKLLIPELLDLTETLHNKNIRDKIHGALNKHLCAMGFTEYADRIGEAHIRVGMPFSEVRLMRSFIGNLGAAS